MRDLGTKLRRDTSWLDYRENAIAQDDNGLMYETSWYWREVGWCQVERLMPPIQQMGVDGIAVEYKMKVSFRRDTNLYLLLPLKKGVVVRISERSSFFNDDVEAVILGADHYSWRNNTRLVLWL